jgi:MraZ protein
MFLGEYEYKVDSKGRLPLPPKFRSEFKEGLVLTRGPEDCVVVYRKSDFEKLAGAFANKTIAKSKIRKFNRITFGNAFHTEMDRQGRIALPQTLRKRTHIGDTVMLIGANNVIELWNPDKWNTEQAESEGQSWQIIESLEEPQ